MTITDLEPEFDRTQWLNTQVAVAGHQVARRFHGYVEYTDLHQLLWEWVLKHDAKITRWMDDNDDGGERILGYTLVDEGSAIARKAKARILGYSTHDVFYYTKPVIEELLPTALQPDDWLTPPTDHGNGKSGKALNEGNNWLATLSDISRGYARLDPPDQALLAEVFRDGVPRGDIAGREHISHKGVDHRVDRAIRRLWKHLGGPKWLAPEERNSNPVTPVGTRKVMSNATARALTDNQWDPS